MGSTAGQYGLCFFLLLQIVVLVCFFSVSSYGSSLMCMCKFTASRRRTPSCSAAASSSTTSAATSSSTSGVHRHATTTASPSPSRSSRSRLAAARASLPSPPLLYSFQELAAATNGFLSKRDSSSTYWRCSLRGCEAALFQHRAVPGLTPTDASAVLARTARYHHASLAPLLGACFAGPHVYVAYRLPPAAATLAACLFRSCSGSKNLNLVGSWLSRVQVAADIAQGIDYAHVHAGAVHGRLSPSTVFLVPYRGLHGLRATVTHFGAKQFAQSDNDAAAQSDVRAFGVLLLQLLSGEAEASRYHFDRATKKLARVSVLDTAADALRTGRVRTWVDQRLGDTFPVPAAEKLVEVALRCASPAEERPAPEMSWVAGKVSKVYVESRAWEHQRQHCDGYSVSLAPR